MISARVFRNGKIEDIFTALRTDPRMASQLKGELDAEFRANETKLFSSQGASGGSRWPALSPEYAKRKAGLRRADLKQSRMMRGLGFRRGITIAGQKILVLGGGLRDSLTKSGPDHISEVLPGGKMRFAFGTSYPLAHYHHEGGPNLPVRDPIQHTDEQMGRYQKIAAEFYLTRVRRANRGPESAGAKVPV